MVDKGRVTLWSGAKEIRHADADAEAKRRRRRCSTHPPVRHAIPTNQSRDPVAAEGKTEPALGGGNSQTSRLTGVLVNLDAMLPTPTTIVALGQGLQYLRLHAGIPEIPADYLWPPQGPRARTPIAQTPGRGVKIVRASSSQGRDPGTRRRKEPRIVIPTPVYSASRKLAPVLGLGLSRGILGGETAVPPGFSSQSGMTVFLANQRGGLGDGCVGLQECTRSCTYAKITSNRAGVTAFVYFSCSSPEDQVVRNFVRPISRKKKNGKRTRSALPARFTSCSGTTSSVHS